MAHLLLLLTLLALLGALLLLALALLEQSLRHEDLVLSRDAPICDMSVGPLAKQHDVGCRSEELRHSGLLALMHSPLSTLYV